MTPEKIASLRLNAQQARVPYRGPVETVLGDLLDEAVDEIERLSRHPNAPLILTSPGTMIGTCGGDSCTRSVVYRDPGPLILCEGCRDVKPENSPEPSSLPGGYRFTTCSAEDCPNVALLHMDDRDPPRCATHGETRNPLAQILSAFPGSIPGSQCLDPSCSTSVFHAAGLEPWCPEHKGD